MADSGSNELVGTYDPKNVVTRPLAENVNYPPKRRLSVDLETLYQANAVSCSEASFGYLFVKRSIDIIGAIAGLVLCFPVILVAATLIKLSDGGTILFKQTRVGRRGKLFSIYKFRSMLVNADEIKHNLMNQNHHSDNRTFKILNDPRITKVGRFIRRLSIDEIPQFWNVLRGDMSLVGPRPALPAEVAIYNQRDFVRLSVKPGLTCIWQVSGRSNLDFSQQIQLDFDYISQRSILLDLKLLAMTPMAVIRGDGAA